MTLPTSNTPLYNHPLPAIEHWLSELGCQQDRENLNRWTIDRSTWKAELCLDIEELVVCYINAGEGGSDLQRSFKYSLSRQDVEAAIFSGP
jgi:Protein of unknown function (DUF3143)